MTVGIHGRILKAMKNMYSGIKSCLRINNTFTDWFSIDKGDRQGNNLDPMLFALFINDLPPEINSLNCGISVDGDFSLTTLLYADDIVFLASRAEGLQEQLETLNNRSTKWALSVNIDKIKVLHVRKASVASCEYRFKLGDLVVD